MNKLGFFISSVRDWTLTHRPSLNSLPRIIKNIGIISNRSFASRNEQPRPIRNYFKVLLYNPTLKLINKIFNLFLKLIEKLRAPAHNNPGYASLSSVGPKVLSEVELEIFKIEHPPNSKRESFIRNFLDKLLESREDDLITREDYHKTAQVLLERFNKCQNCQNKDEILPIASILAAHLALKIHSDTERALSNTCLILKDMKINITTADLFKLELAFLTGIGWDVSVPSLTPEG